jgi:predicted kinase
MVKDNMKKIIEDTIYGIGRDNLVHWFITNYPNLHKDMVLANHAVQLDIPNIFHAEGTVWTHTMMVMTWIEAKHKSDSRAGYRRYIKLLTTGLLHDIGKPLCLEQMEPTELKPLRNSFNGHEGVSTWNAVGILKHLQIEAPQIYTDEMISDILTLISTHGVYVDDNTDLEALKNDFREADKCGAIRLVEEGKFDKYTPRKYLKRNRNDDTESVVIFMCGLPNVGKSTYINSELYKDYFIVSRDSLLTTFHFEKMGYMATYNEIYRDIHNDDTLLKEFEEQFRQLLQTASKKEKVIVDMTLMSLSSRRKMLNNFPHHRAHAKVIMTDKENILQRNEERGKAGKYIHSNVLEGMMKSFVIPIKEEGFAKVELIIN